jgi:energy-coupling factor transport system permease protein
MQMRGAEMDNRKVSVFKRLKQTVMLVVPLLISSFGKVESIANAMDLRGFGRKKRRSWYSEHEPGKLDYIFRGVTLLLLAFGIFYVIYFRVLNPFPATYWYFNIR